MEIFSVQKIVFQTSLMVDRAFKLFCLLHNNLFTMLVINSRYSREYNLVGAQNLIFNAMFWEVNYQDKLTKCFLD